MYIHVIGFTQLHEKADAVWSAEIILPNKSCGNERVKLSRCYQLRESQLSFERKIIIPITRNHFPAFRVRRVVIHYDFTVARRPSGVHGVAVKIIRFNGVAFAVNGFGTVRK